MHNDPDDTAKFLAADEKRAAHKALRDQFAMVALPAVIAAVSAKQHTPRVVFELEAIGQEEAIDMASAIAVEAYRMADAMFFAREFSSVQVKSGRITVKP